MTTFSHQGYLRKMQVQYEGAENPVHYTLNLTDEAGEVTATIALNELIGKQLRLLYQAEIHCVACGRKTKKSFNQGHCYPCFTRLASCDSCIMSPEKCHYDQGTCREPQWGLDNCMQTHYVYLANSSGLKVGITRGNQVPTRWVDQGAIQALPVFKVDSRYHSGLLEVLYKKEISDRTQWQRMLKGQVEEIDLLAEQQRLYQLFQAEVEALAASLPDALIEHLDNDTITQINYPVSEYPTRIKSFNLDKNPEVSGNLMGIKGQYLIFDTGVINIRKFAGYGVQLSY
jgi:hypothetical protein